MIMSRSAAETANVLLRIECGQRRCHPTTPPPLLQSLADMFSLRQEICKHEASTSHAVCVGVYVCLMQRESGGKTERADEGGQAGEMEELWKNDWRRAAGRKRGKRDRWCEGGGGRRDSKTRNGQWSRWIDFADRWLGGLKKHGRFIPPMKPVFGWFCGCEWE